MMKRQQQQQPVDAFDPSIPIDTDLMFKDPLKHKESEQEQEWKLRQVIDISEDNFREYARLVFTNIDQSFGFEQRNIFKIQLPFACFILADILYIVYFQICTSVKHGNSVEIDLLMKICSIQMY